MKVIKPKAYAPSMLASTTAVETYAAWSSATTYALNAIVDYGTSLYQSLQASNLNKQPDTNPTWWLRIGPDNTHAMFDAQVSTATTATNVLTVAVNVGAINSVAAVGLVGTTLHLMLKQTPDSFTSRASSATYVDAAGALQLASSNVARYTYDPVTKAPLGLLVEAAATNLLLNSVLAGTSLSTQSVTVTAAQHTLSFYGTGTVTLSGAATGTLAGAGAYPARASLTFTPTAGSLTVTVSGTVQFAQLELGAAATSFIPTAGSAVTRAADVGSAGTIVYQKTLSLDGTIISDWYQYFFEESVQLGEIVVTDVTPYPNAQLHISLQKAGAVEIGNLLFGSFYDLGETEFGASAGITDYSVKETDEFGDVTFVPRTFAKRMTARMELAAGQMNKVQRVLADVRATPCVWIGADDAQLYAPLIVYGWYRDFSIDVAYPTTSYVSLEVEGLT